MKLIDGNYLDDRLATYPIPTALDAPRIQSILVEKPFAGVPHRAKGSASCNRAWATGGGGRDPRRDRGGEPTTCPPSGAGARSGISSPPGGRSSSGGAAGTGALQPRSPAAAAAGRRSGPR